MNSDILFGLAFLSLSLVSTYLWKKSRHKIYLWGTLLYVAGFLSDTFNYYINNIVNVSLELRQASYYLSMVLLPVIVVMSLYLLKKVDEDGKTKSTTSQTKESK